MAAASRERGTAASRCTLNRIEVTVTESRSVTLCTGIDLYSNKYPCQVLLDKGAWDGSEPGAWDAPPLNRIEVTVAESQSLTPGTGIDLYSNKYPCQVVLDTKHRSEPLHP